MLKTFPHGLHEAGHLMDAGRLVEATAAIQRLLGGHFEAPTNTDTPGRRESQTIDGSAISVDNVMAPLGRRTPDAKLGILSQLVTKNLVSGKLGVSPALIAVPQGAQFLTATLTNAAGSRPYKHTCRAHTAPIGLPRSS